MNTVKKTEIERKFLMRDLPMDVVYDDIIFIQQFYIPSEIEGPNRVRFNFDTIPVPKSFIPRKGELRDIEAIDKLSISDGINEESHYDISEKEAWNYATEHERVLNKIRFVWADHSQGIKFEIDYFKDARVVLLEVEVNDLKQNIEFPPFIEREIIGEVTGNKLFNSFNLAYKK